MDSKHRMLGRPQASEETKQEAAVIASPWPSEQITDAAARQPLLVHTLAELSNELKDYLNRLEVSVASLTDSSSETDEVRKRKILSQLFIIEHSPWRSRLRWAYIDSLLERLLHFTVVHREATLPQAPEAASCCPRRQLFSGRAIPVNNDVTLRTIKAFRAAIRGLEEATFDAIHLFFYGILGLHLEHLVTEGNFAAGELWQSLTHVNNNGLVNLAQGLARLPKSVLYLILVSPFIWASLRSGLSLIQSRIISDEALEKLISDTRPRCGDNFCGSELVQWIPLLPENNTVQRLERALRWEAQLTSVQREKIFQCIKTLAFDGAKKMQRTAMQSLAKIAQSFHAHDLETLKQQGYEAETLKQFWQFKIECVSTLEQLSHYGVNGNWWQQSMAAFWQTPRVLYAHYLLCWLGMPRNAFTQGTFLSFKLTKLAFEILLIVTLIRNIIEAIHCPDKPGFHFGDGLSSWSGKYTYKCWLEFIKLYNSIIPGQPASDITELIPKFHLPKVIDLDLSNKRLVGEQIAPIMQALTAHGIRVRKLNLSSNAINTPSGMQALMPTLSQVEILDISNNWLGEEKYSGLAEFNFCVGMQYLTNVIKLNLQGNNFISLAEIEGKNITILFAENLLYLKRIQSLNINSVAFDFDARSMAAVMRGLSQLKTLTSLTISSPYVVEPFSTHCSLSYLNPLGELNNLRYLTIADLLFTCVSSVITGVGAFAHGLSQLSHLLELQFPNINLHGINSNQIEALMQAISQLTALRVFKISNLPFPINPIMPTVANAVGHLINLRALTLQSVPNNLNGTLALTNNLMLLVKLQHLDLSGNYFGFDSGLNFILLMQSISHLKRLTYLDLGMLLAKNYSQALRALGQSLLSISALEVLKFEGASNFIFSEDVDAVMQFTQSLKHLRRLKYFGQPSVNPPYNSTGPLKSKACELLSNGLQPTQVHNKYALVSKQSVEQAIFQLDLEVTGIFNLSSSLLCLPTAVGIDILMEQLRHYPKLKVLDLSNNFLGLWDQSAQEALFKGLAGLTELEVIDLSRPPIGDISNGIIANNILLLGKSLSRLSQLRKLNLNNLELGFMTETQAYVFQQYLSRLRQLEVLELANFRYAPPSSPEILIPKGVYQAFIGALPYLSRLRELNLAGFNSSALLLKDSLTQLIYLRSLIINFESTASLTLASIEALIKLKGLVYLKVTNYDSFNNDTLLEISKTQLSIALRKLPLLQYLSLPIDTLILAGSTHTTNLIADAIAGLQGLLDLLINVDYPLTLVNSNAIQALLNAIAQLPQLRQLAFPPTDNVFWPLAAKALASVHSHALEKACKANLCFGTPLGAGSWQTSSANQRATVPDWIALPIQAMMQLPKLPQLLWQGAFSSSDALPTTHYEGSYKTDIEFQAAITPITPSASSTSWSFSQVASNVALSVVIVEVTRKVCNGVWSWWWSSETQTADKSEENFMNEESFKEYIKIGWAKLKQARNLLKQLANATPHSNPMNSHSLRGWALVLSTLKENFDDLRQNYSGGTVVTKEDCTEWEADLDEFIDEITDVIQQHVYTVPKISQCGKAMLFCQNNTIDKLSVANSLENRMRVRQSIVLS